MCDITRRAESPAAWAAGLALVLSPIVAASGCGHTGDDQVGSPGQTPTQETEQPAGTSYTIEPDTASPSPQETEGDLHHSQTPSPNAQALPFATVVSGQSVVNDESWDCMLTDSCCGELLVELITTQQQLQDRFLTLLPQQPIPMSIDFNTYSSLLSYTLWCPSGDKSLSVNLVLLDYTHTLQIEETLEYGPTPPELAVRPYNLVTIPSGAYERVEASLTEVDTRGSR